MRHKRWQWWYRGRRVDVCFPHGPRDYPTWQEARMWIPSIWFRIGGPDWPCYQLDICRLYIRWWYADVRWSAAAKSLVLIAPK